MVEGWEASMVDEGRTRSCWYRGGRRKMRLLQRRWWWFSKRGSVRVGASHIDERREEDELSVKLSAAWVAEEGSNAISVGPSGGESRE
jgi:hypothetical protein